MYNKYTHMNNINLDEFNFKALDLKCLRLICWPVDTDDSLSPEQRPTDIAITVLDDNN